MFQAKYGPPDLWMGFIAIIYFKFKLESTLKYNKGKGKGKLL
jgi:hypothetical protein